MVTGYFKGENCNFLICEYHTSDIGVSIPTGLKVFFLFIFFMFYRQKCVLETAPRDIKLVH